MRIKCFPTDDFALPLIDHNAKGLFEQAQKFVWRAVLCAKAGQEVFVMLGDLGEVLRGSGALRDAERVLRSALQSNSLPTHVRKR